MKRDQYHQWVKSVLSQDEFTFVTCEAVLTETLYLTKYLPRVVGALYNMMENNLLIVNSALSNNKGEIFSLLNTYHDQKTSLADVSLIALYNKSRTSNAPIFTTDSDFLIYRDGDGNPLNLITPYKS